MKVKQAPTRATVSMIRLTGPWMVASPRSAPVPVTEWPNNRQIAGYRGEWYLHTVIGR